MFLNRGVSAFWHKSELKEAKAEQWHLEHDETLRRGWNASRPLLTWVSSSTPPGFTSTVQAHRGGQGGLALGATYSSKQATFFIEPCTKHSWDQETGLLEKASHSTLWGKDTKAHEQRRNWHGPQPRHHWYPSQCCLLKSLWQRWQGIELREENHRPPRRYWEYSPCILNWGRPKDMVEVRLVRSLG